MPKGGFFRVDLTFGCDYPRVPPKCRFTALEEADISDVTIGRFVTKIFHPNVVC
jgi:ubiquitin-protein ligase